MAVRSAVVQIGRGMKYPFKIVNGGVEYNIPTNPTDAEVVAAVNQAIRRVVTTAIGEMFMARDFGTIAHDALFSGGSAANTDAISQSIIESIQTFVPYIRPTRVVTIYNNNEGRLEIRYTYILRNETRERSDIVSITGG